MPPIKVRADDGTLYDIPIEEIGPRIQSGEWWGFEKPPVVTMVSQEGRRVGIRFTPEKLREAAGAGFRLETPDEQRGQWLKQEYGGAGGEASAFLLNALDTATLGLGKMALTESGIIDKREWGAWDETNPTAAFTGSLAGIVAPTGAAGRVAKLAQLGKSPGAVAKGLAAMPAARLAKWSTRIEKGILGKGAPTLARRVGAKAAAYGAEGAVWGAHAGVSDAINENIPLLSEEMFGRALSGATFGGFFGGTLGAAAPVLGAGLRKIVPKRKPKAPVKVGDDPFQPTGADVPLPDYEAGGAFARGYVRGAKKIRGDKYAEALHYTTNHPMAKKVRDAIENAPKYTDESIDVVHKATGKAERAWTNDVEWLWQRGAKSEQMARLVSEGGETEAFNATAEFLREFHKTVDDLQSVAGRDAEGFFNSFRKGLSSMEAEWSGMVARFQKTGKLPSKKALFSLGDRLKIDIGNLSDDLLGKAKTDGMWRAYDTMWAEGRGVYSRFRRFLEDAALWGDAAVAQKEINSPFHEWMRYRSADYGLKLLKRGEQVRIGGKDVVGKNYWDPDKGQVKKLLTLAGDESMERPIEYWMRDYNSRRSIVQAMKKWGLDVPESAVKAFDDVSNLFGKHVKRMANVNKAVGWGNIISGKTGLVSEIPTTSIAYIIGHLIYGYAGGLVGMAGGFALRPSNVVGAKSLVDRLARSGAMSETVQGARGGIRASISAKTRAIFGRSVPIGLQVYRAEKDKKKRAHTPASRLKAFRALRRQLETLRDPQALMSRLEGSLAALGEEVPQLATGMSLVAQRAIEHLLATMPRPVTSGLLGTIREEEIRISDHDLARWFKRLAVVEDPTTALDSMKKGQLSKEEVETLRAVYPELHQKMGSLLMAHASEKNSRQIARQIGLFIGIPLLRVDSPEFVQANQMRYAMARQGMTEQVKGFDPAKATKIDEQNRSGMQAWEAHRSE